MRGREREEENGKCILLRIHRLHHRRHHLLPQPNLQSYTLRSSSEVLSSSSLFDPNRTSTLDLPLEFCGGPNSDIALPRDGNSTWTASTQGAELGELNCLTVGGTAFTGGGRKATCPALRNSDWGSRVFFGLRKTTLERPLLTNPPNCAKVCSIWRSRRTTRTSWMHLRINTTNESAAMNPITRTKLIFCGLL